ncbi:MAG: hypothetical protein Q9221_005512 [Calogaya cf. arnoldii]
MSPDRKESVVEDATLKLRQSLTGASGPKALVKNGKVFGLACFACLGGFVYGYNQGVFSGILTMNSSDMGDWVSNSTRKGWLTAIFELGAWLGCLYSSFLAEILSRKYAILVNVGIFVVGVVIQSVAVVGGLSCIIAGRFITGLAIGAMSVNVPNYNAEVAPPEVRGSLVALQQLAITAGIMVSFWIDYATHYIGGTGEGQSDAVWIIPICLQLIPGLALGVGILFMPFSPRWLVHHGREGEARTVLSSLRNLEQDDPLIELEFLEIKAQSVFEKRNTAEKWPHLVALTPMNTFKLQFVAIGSLFTTKAMFRRVIVATVTMFFQQFTGINAAENQSCWPDRWAWHSAISQSQSSSPKNQYQWATHKTAGWAAVAMVWFFVVNFGYSWGPCAWVLIAEVWPLSNRAYGIALGASSNWMSNFIVGQITPDMLKHISYGTFIFYGLMVVAGAFFLWLYVPETKRLKLEEMDVVFGSVGVARADSARMRETNREIGLDDVLRNMGIRIDNERSDSSGDEKSRDMTKEQIEVKT